MSRFIPICAAAALLVVLLVLAAEAATPAPPTAASVLSQYDNCVLADPVSGFALYWSLAGVPGSQTAQIAMTMNATYAAGWFAFGLSNNTDGKAMLNSDIVLGWLSDPQTPYLYEYNTLNHTVHSPPDLDSQQNVFLVGGLIDTAANVAVIQMVRSLNTNDSAEDLVWNTNYTLIWAANDATHPPATGVLNGSLRHDYYSYGALDQFNFLVPSPCGNSSNGGGGGNHRKPPGGEVQPSDCGSSGSVRHGYKSPDGTYALDWTLDCHRSEITVTATAHTTGWLGFGISEEGAMPDSDIAMFAYDNLNATADRWATQHSQPPLDTQLQPPGTEDVQVLNGTQQGGVTSITFRRRLVTGDQWDLPIGRGTRSVIWAFNSQTSSFNARHTNIGQANINFLTGASSTPFNYARLHGTMMLLAWGFLAFLGSFVARYMKDIGPAWFVLHLLLQLTTLALSSAAFGIIVYQTQRDGVRHFSSLHPIFGLVVVILSLLQSLLGVLGALIYCIRRGKGRSSPPDWLHWYLGRFLMALGIVAIYLGFRKIGAPLAVYFVFAAWLGATALVAFYSTLFIDTAKWADRKRYRRRASRIRRANASVQQQPGAPPLASSSDDSDNGESPQDEDDDDDDPATVALLPGNSKHGRFRMPLFVQRLVLAEAAFRDLQRSLPLGRTRLRKALHASGVFLVWGVVGSVLIGLSIAIIYHDVK